MIKRLQKYQKKYPNLHKMRKFILLAFSYLLVTSAQSQVLNPLGSGLPFPVVASYATDQEYFALYEDLSTTSTNDYTMARWNGVYWKFYPGLTVPDGVQSTQGKYNFHSIAFYNNQVYVGGYITEALQDADFPMAHLYKWNETSRAWEAAAGVIETKNDGISCMTVFDGRLIVAGKFYSSVDGNWMENIAAYDGSKWRYLGMNETKQGANGFIRNLLVSGNRLYIGGDFSRFAGDNTGNIAYYTAANGGWGGIGSPIKGAVLELASFDGNIAALGTDSMGKSDVRIFKGTWSKLPSFDSFTISDVKTISGANQKLLLGGTFVKNNNGTSLLYYNPSVQQYFFTGNRFQGQFKLGQRGNGSFVWGDYRELNTDIRYFSAIEFAYGNLYGDLFYDKNANCKKDADEMGIPSAIMRVVNKSNGSSYFVVTDAFGHFSIGLPEGDYTIQHTSKRHMYTVCAGNYSTSIRNGKYSSVSLGEYFAPTIKDLEVKLRPVYPVELNAGDTLMTVLMVTNHGATTLNGTTVHISHALPLANFHSIPEADNYNGIEATFALLDLKPFETRTIQLFTKIPFNAKSTDNYGLSVKTGSLFAQNDAYQTDNADSIKLSIGKRGNTSGAVTKISDFGSKIDYRTTSWVYTVDFKNIGTDAVSRAVMVDTLDTKLPLQRVLLKSFYPNKATYSIQQGRILVVNFNPANLKTYESNPSQSSGWVQYQIDLYEKLGVSTVIDNTAVVDFDSEWMGRSENCAVNIIDSKVGVNSLNPLSLSVYPNPNNGTFQVEWLKEEMGSNWLLIGTAGNEVKRGLISSSTSTLDIQQIQNGVYFLKTPKSLTKVVILQP